MSCKNLKGFLKGCSKINEKIIFCHLRQTFGKHNKRHQKNCFLNDARKSVLSWGHHNWHLLINPALLPNASNYSGMIFPPSHFVHRHIKESPVWKGQVIQDPFWVIQTHKEPFSLHISYKLKKTFPFLYHNSMLFPIWQTGSPYNSPQTLCSLGIMSKTNCIERNGR